jgi:hypothetical protein
MITVPRELAGRELDLDLSSKSPSEAAGLLDAVSFDSFLGYIFNVLLHRAPDQGGAAHYRKRVNAGASRQSVVADLLASREFQDRHGVKSRRRQPLEDFVKQTYQDVLGRWPDEDGRKTYIRIGSKWRGRSKVERTILNSPEAQRSGGGRLARIKALEAYARQSRLLKLPVIGTGLRRHNDLVARLARIEHLLSGRVLGTPAQQLAAALPPAPAPAPAMVPNLLEAVPHTIAPAKPAPDNSGLPALREAHIETLDAATATKLEKDGWVFRVAVRDARRKNLAKGEPEKASR